MSIFLVRRRGIARSARELDAAFVRLRRFEDRPAASAARWLHSYALREDDGSFGLACIFDAVGVRDLRIHARSTALRADEITPVTRWQIDRDLTSGPLWYARQAGAPGPDAGPLHRLRSYAVLEDDATAGCRSLHDGVDGSRLAELLRDGGRPALELLPVLGRVVFRDDAGFVVHPLPPAACSRRTA